MICMIVKTSNHFALQDYLETKRVAFPRFYFVAPADLLDILSKGSDPQAILRSPSNSYLFLLSVLCVYLMRMALLTCLFLQIRKRTGIFLKILTICTIWSSARTLRAMQRKRPSGCIPVITVVSLRMILGADFEDFQACKCFGTHNFRMAVS